MNHIIDTEKIIIGYLLNNGNKPGAIKLISDIKDDYFFDVSTLKAFDSIREIIMEGGDVNMVSVRESSKLKATFLTSCLDTICLNPEYQIKQLKKYADKRWLLSKLHSTSELAQESKPEELMASLSTELIGRVREVDSENTNMKTLINKFEDYQITNQQAVEDNGMIGLSFGFKSIDTVISGIRPGHYIVVKAATSTGKSAFSLNIVSTVLNQDKRVLLFSLEMSQEQNIARLLGIRTNINALAIEAGRHKDDGVELDQKEILFKQRLDIIEQKRTIDEILTFIRAEYVIEKVDLVVIDYIQNISITGERYDGYTNASNKIQTLAKVLKIPILVCSQVNKTGDARGSGDIDNHADLAILLEKTDEIGKIDMQITKNRHGMLNGSKLKFCDGGNLIEII